MDGDGSRLVVVAWMGYVFTHADDADDDGELVIVVFIYFIGCQNEKLDILDEL